MVARLTFQQKRETFGFDTNSPWALNAFHLLFNVPRAFSPLVDVWDTYNPGTKKALTKLVNGGWVYNQPSIIINKVTNKQAKGTTKKSTFYQLTPAGKRALEAESAGLNALRHEFPRMSLDNLEGVQRLLLRFILPGEESLKLPAKVLIRGSGLAGRTGRWWIKSLNDLGWISVAGRFPEAEEVVPEHWRVSRKLCTHLKTLFKAYPETSQGLTSLFRLNRTSFLKDIPLSVITKSGGSLSDYQHDINTQKILSLMLRSKRALPNSVVNIEPKVFLPSVYNRKGGYYQFTPKGAGKIFYQPDAELREVGAGNRIFRSMVEYERQQSRKDGWKHIERFIAYLHLNSTPWEGGILRFVMDSPRRANVYVELITAYADYCLTYPERVPNIPVVLAVSCIQWLEESSDALRDGKWLSVVLPADSSIDANKREAVLHMGKNSPYFDYFAGGGEQV